ncbi:MAG: hypothetical protein JJ920_03330 [Roseitalea sp.]|jgi:predicted nuclease with TOPRIM domain|nr:hypothetical protein [Roseitalea sp.]MBO6723507.1 hypothetical protein [Roseitalea sp.]MBO6741916.1 hypothetical protein [Roseitalea sp.]
MQKGAENTVSEGGVSSVTDSHRLLLEHIAERAINRKFNTIYKIVAIGLASISLAIIFAIFFWVDGRVQASIGTKVDSSVAREAAKINEQFDDHREDLSGFRDEIGDTERDLGRIEEVAERLDDQIEDMTTRLDSKIGDQENRLTASLAQIDELGGRINTQSTHFEVFAQTFRDTEAAFSVDLDRIGRLIESAENQVGGMAARRPSQPTGQGNRASGQVVEAVAARFDDVEEVNRNLRNELGELRFLIDRQLAAQQETESDRGDLARDLIDVRRDVASLETRLTGLFESVSEISSSAGQRGFNDIAYGTTSDWEQCPDEKCFVTAPFAIRTTVRFDRNRFGLRPIFLSHLSGTNGGIFASAVSASYFYDDDNYYQVIVRFDNPDIELTPDMAENWDWRLHYAILPDPDFVR